MKRHAAPGFTLIELTIALALSGFLALASLAALDSLGQESSALESSARGEALAERGCARVAEELSLAQQIKLDASAVLMQRVDARWVGYALSPKRTQLHRVEAASETAARLALKNLALDRLGSEPQLEEGTLPESAFRDHAVMLGMRQMEWAIEERAVTVPAMQMEVGLQRAFDFRGFDKESFALLGAPIEPVAIQAREPFDLGDVRAGLSGTWIGMRFRTTSSMQRMRRVYFDMRRVATANPGAFEVVLVATANLGSKLGSARIERTALADLPELWTRVAVALEVDLAPNTEYAVLISSSGGEGGIELRAETLREEDQVPAWRLDDGLALALARGSAWDPLEYYSAVRLIAALECEQALPAPAVQQHSIAVVFHVVWSKGHALTRRIPLLRLAEDTRDLERRSWGLSEAGAPPVAPRPTR